MVSISALSDVGRVRTNNEDFFHCDPDNGLIILADGVGGHDFGEVASELATVSCYSYLMLEPDLDDLKSMEAALLESIKYANQKVIDRKAANADYKNMGTTLTCLHLADRELRYAWVGDSRIYIVNVATREIRQLTTDHTVYEELKKRGEMPARSARSILTRMVGNNSYVRPDSGMMTLAPGDVVLVCSDGLSDLVPEIKMLDTLERNGDDLGISLKELVGLANNEGGRDNVTVILARPD